MLLLVGSPRLSFSTSESLGSYVTEALNRKGWQTSCVRLLSALRSEERIRGLLSEVERADLLVLAAPLYVDSCPAPVIRAMELISQRSRESGWSRKRLLAIVNCGFPESFHNDVALAIYRQFAKEAGFVWVGGLSLGMGGFISGRPLVHLGRVGKRIRNSLDLAAEALAQDQPLPAKAVELMGKKMMPKWLYLFMGNLGWRREARKRGVAARLNDRPYAADQNAGEAWR